MSAVGQERMRWYVIPVASAGVEGNSGVSGRLTTSRGAIGVERRRPGGDQASMDILMRLKRRETPIRKTIIM